MTSPISEIKIQKSSQESNKSRSFHTSAAEEEVERQLEDASERLLFVFPELRASLLAKRETAAGYNRMDSSSPPLLLQATRQTGVLWKRRDVFKNRWRPRWFCVNPAQGILTYYLLNDNTSNLAVEQTTTATPLSSRHRTTSWDGSAVSGVSENSLDYDVVPRGTIFLLGCTVSINDTLSQPRESLYAFTIRPPPHSGGTNVHLAARTASTREQWVAQLDQVCRMGTTGQNNPNNATAATTVQIDGSLRRPSGNLLAQEHSIPEEGEGETSSQPDDLLVPHDPEHQLVFKAWRSTGSPEQLFKNVPESLAAHLEECLSQNLPLLLDDGDVDLPQPTTNDPSSSWKLLFHHTDTGHRAWQRWDSSTGRTMVQSTAVLRSASPLQVLRLLWDVSRRTHYETNLSTSSRLQSLNQHTAIDYYAYHAVWPTAAREFVVTSHWQVMQQQQRNSNTNRSNAIVIVSCSNPEADAVQPVPAPKHVRGHLYVSLYVLRPCSGTNAGCHLTRLVSFDLAGGVNRHLSNVICQQQARLPAILEEYMERHEPVTETRLRSPHSHSNSSQWLTNDHVQRNVVDRMSQTTRTARPPSPMSHDESFLSMGDEDFSDAASATAKKGKAKECQEDTSPSIEAQAVVLLAPSVIYCLMLASGLPGAALLFLLSAVAAIRHVVSWHLGKPLPSGTLEATLVGPVTCRFQVDLKGILRFIANQAEARDEDQTSGVADVSVVHIVASAVSRALKREPDLHIRRTSISWLGIDQYVDASSEPVNVSISEHAGGIVTLKAVDGKSIQAIADELADAEECTRKTTNIGQCLVLCVSGSSNGDDPYGGGAGDDEIQTDVATEHPNVTVVATVGGVHLDHNYHHRSARGVMGITPPPPPRPVLSLSLTINGHGRADVVACRRYALEVRKLLQFPEMCEG